MATTKLDERTSVEFRRAPSRNNPSVYIVRRDGVVVGRYYSRSAAYRKAREVQSGTIEMPLAAPQKSAIGLFKWAKVRL